MEQIFLLLNQLVSLVLVLMLVGFIRALNDHAKSMIALADTLFEPDDDPQEPDEVPEEHSAPVVMLTSKRRAA